jgi:hypothetical protein
LRVAIHERDGAVGGAEVEAYGIDVVLRCLHWVYYFAVGRTYRWQGLS